MHIPIEDEFVDNFQENIEIPVEDCKYTNIKKESTEKDSKLVYDETKYINTLKLDPVEESSKIIVQSRLGSITGEVISKAKINLYMLNGISPKLVDSKLTDKNGIAIFDKLDHGSYRIIAIVDKKYFQKPSYITWNEITIHSNTQTETITVINKVKTTY